MLGYIRVRNTKALDLWWRIQDFSVETRSGNSDLTDTNVDALKETPVVDSLGSYELRFQLELNFLQIAI